MRAMAELCQGDDVLLPFSLPYFCSLFSSLRGDDMDVACSGLATSLIDIVDIFPFNVITGMFGINYTILFHLLPLGGLLSGFLSLSSGGLFGHLVELYF